MRKPKKPSISRLKKKADILWSQLVKIKANDKCEVCGKGRGEVTLNSHHIVGRKFLPFRHLVRNGVCLCALHHQFSPDQSAHSNPLFFHTWLNKNRHADLFFLSGSYNNARREGYAEIVERLTKEMASHGLTGKLKK